MVAPKNYNAAWLIDMSGRTINKWDIATPPSLGIYLLPDGSILCPGKPVPDNNQNFANAGGAVRQYNWAGDLVMEFECSTTRYRQHHDIEPMPDGNVLVLAWEYHTSSEAEDMGRDTGTMTDGILFSAAVLEYHPDGSGGANVVWQWRSWDHLVQDSDLGKPGYGAPDENMQRININYLGESNKKKDWMHCNSVSYDAASDIIVISSRNFNEFWILDHGTTTAQASGTTGGARGHGGDLLYRWGNPAAWDGTGDNVLCGQHDVKIIPAGVPGAGHLTCFNNGWRRPGTSDDYSTADEWILPMDGNGDFPDPDPQSWTASLAWRYTASPPTDLYSAIMGGVQRLPNGNTLICSAANGTALEITSSGDVVWHYVNPVTGSGPIGWNATSITGNLIFRFLRIAPEELESTGYDLTPGDFVEDPAEP